MLRSLVGNVWRAASCVPNLSVQQAGISFAEPLRKSFYSSMQANYKASPTKLQTSFTSITLLQPSYTAQGLLLQSTRDLTKFSLNKGKRKSVKAVVKRFKRLDWGCWIRTHCGRHKKLYKKSPALKRRLRQHIFTNSTQSWLLDKMVGSFWRRPKNWIDDPYAPYNKRDEFFATKSKTFKV